MLDHISITVSDLGPSSAFYDAIMTALGHQCVRREHDMLGYGVRNTAIDDSHTYISIVPIGSAIEASSRHWCFRATDRASVDEFYAAGLASGGTDDGVPGVRDHYHAHYYAAFLRDPDGNRIEAVYHRAG